MMRILVTGKNGQLGKSIHKLVANTEQTDDFVFVGREELDLSSKSSITNYFNNNDKFNIIINCAAYTAVDKAEEEQELANQVNHLAVEQLARIANQQKAKLIYISTDYVFDGESDKPYIEIDKTNPINVYGASKYLGEIFVKNCLSQHYIVRTSSLYGIRGAKGKKENFIDTIAKSGKQRKCFEVVDDVYMSPTYTKDLAVMIGEIVENDLPFGIYHLSNKGSCSWFEFAKNILKFLGINGQIKPIKAKDFEGGARRPKSTVLANTKIESLGFKMRTWEKALEEFIGERSKSC